MATKHLILVVNARGGTRQGLAILETVKPVFRTCGAELDVRITTGPGHAEQIAESIDLAGRDGVCLIGGDGTIHCRCRLSSIARSDRFAWSRRGLIC